MYYLTLKNHNPVLQYLKHNDTNVHFTFYIYSTNMVTIFGHVKQGVVISSLWNHRPFKISASVHSVFDESLPVPLT